MNTHWKKTLIGSVPELKPEVIQHKGHLGVPEYTTEIFAEEIMTGITAKAIFVLYMQQKQKKENTPA